MGYCPALDDVRLIGNRLGDSMPSIPILLMLVGASLLAGFVDAVAGGGGLITIPALLLGLPTQPITTILGTNKVVACSGTTFAAAQFLHTKVIDRRELIAPVLMAMGGSACGVTLAYILQGRYESWLRPAMLGLMILVAVITVLKPDLGKIHAPRHGVAHQRLLASIIAAILGFYDGIFGPGTGVLLIFLFVSVLGFDFLRASALAKTVNWASNFAAMVLFLARGSWLPMLALSMALGNGIGGFFGARLAIERGSTWVRALFLVVVAALVCRLGWQILR